MQVTFARVDIDDPWLVKTVTKHSITGVPTFFVYKGGKRTQSFVGARVDYLKEVVTKAAAAANSKK
jgi:REP element-mobilizing transposase RayT